ncbi:MAG: sterol-binding protein [Actinomycetia bacterium]|jgi:putative sterol carrier protein|nr:sterol-binding protein [Actinomycetes bacterium]
MGVVTDSTTEFFQELGRRGREALLEKANGSIRFDLADGSRTERWFVTLDRGDVSVSHKNAAADCVVCANRALFDGIVRGEVNGMASLLRGEMTSEGDPAFLVLFQRLLPAPAARGGRTDDVRDQR